MKKLFALFFVLALGTAFAADRSGKVAIGYQENADVGTNSRGNWSLKYGVNDKVTAQFLVGFDFGKDINSNANFGARVLYDLVQNENSHFYAGFGFAYNLDENSTVNARNPLAISVPLGFEFNFASLPEIGFSIETGLAVQFDTKGAGKTTTISSLGGGDDGTGTGVGAGALANIGLGVHYYF